MEPCQNPRYIGLTGGIGSGKSTVARFFQELGCFVTDADAVSRRALDPGTACYRRTVETFGAEILLEDGAVNRKRLAAIIFSDDVKREALNGIIHPYVRETMLREAAAAPEEALVIFDVPLLFESKMEDMTSFTVCVVTEDKLRLRRVMERDGVDEAAVRARMAKQMPQWEKATLADMTLINNGTVEELREKTEALYAWLKERQSRLGEA